MSMTIGSLCTGYGRLDHAALTAFGGGRIAWVADPDPHVTALLKTRLPDAPNLGDIRTVDWKHVEPVDVLTASFPCQDISGAGRRAGIKHGTRSSLFFEVIRAIRGLRPGFVVIENVAALRWRGRAAPRPVEPGRAGRPRLAPRFVEWLMGLGDGHVTGADLALPRTAQLRILGDGVVPQQATHALGLLLARRAAVGDDGMLGAA